MEENSRTPKDIYDLHLSKSPKTTLVLSIDENDLVCLDTYPSGETKDIVYLLTLMNVKVQELLLKGFSK